MQARMEKKLTTCKHDIIEPDPDAPDLPPRLEVIEQETVIGRNGFYDVIRADHGINKDPLPLLQMQQNKGEETEMGKNGVYDVIQADYHQESNMDKKSSAFPLSQDCKERETELTRDGTYDTIPTHYEESKGNRIPLSRQKEHLTEMGKNGVYDIIPADYHGNSAPLSRQRGILTEMGLYDIIIPEDYRQKSSGPNKKPLPREESEVRQRDQPRRYCKMHTYMLKIVF